MCTYGKIVVSQIPVLFKEKIDFGGIIMNLVFFHNWYYSSAQNGEKMAQEAIAAIKQNITAFPYRGCNYEIAAAEANAGGDHYWLLLFLVSSEAVNDDSRVMRDKIETWLESIGVARNDDRTTMTAKFDSLQKCLDDAYNGAYTLHDVISSG